MTTKAKRIVAAPVPLPPEPDAPELAPESVAVPIKAPVAAEQRFNEFTGRMDRFTAAGDLIDLLPPK